jgi:hypothetical protein
MLKKVFEGLPENSNAHPQNQLLNSTKKKETYTNQLNMHQSLKQAKSKHIHSLLNILKN